MNLRVLVPGHEPHVAYFAPDVSMGAAIRAAGGDPGMKGMAITADGKPASADTPVGTATTVALEPLANNG
ncbi:MAG TPA: hypothetical protein VHD31_03780 [Candidatus Paceibacterota bacterium]|nr:hypothetical protein [Candidatus Paceibacterota bacterium]